MKNFSTLPRIALAAAILLTLAAAPAPALDRVVDSGLDIWITRGDGSTFFTFENDPLPADFFCSGSEAFVGTIVLQGVPVATSPEGVLGVSDTILQRLDDAVFDQDGVATTRLRMRALHLEGVDLLRNWCGAFRVEVVLDGEQPVTEMRIHRESDFGGRFDAEVAVNGKLIFTPVGHKGEVLEVGRSIVFPPRLNSFWAESPGEGGIRRHAGFVVVDTDANGTPDTFLPGMSRNFAAGWPATPEEEPTEIFRHAARSGLAEANAFAEVQEKEICQFNCHCSAGCGDHCLQAN